MNKQEILQKAAEDREQEVMLYQINIDNFSLAIKRVDAMPEYERKELAEFRSDLLMRLVDSRREQKKAQIMLDVILDQLGA